MRCNGAVYDKKIYLDEHEIPFNACRVRYEITAEEERLLNSKREVNFGVLRRDRRVNCTRQ